MNPLHWLEQHPNAALTAVVGGSLLLLFFAAWVVHWWVVDVRYWLDWLPRRRPVDLPGPESLPAPRAGEHHPSADVWEQLDPDQAADLLIAEWHDEDLPGPDAIAQGAVRVGELDWLSPRDQLSALAWGARMDAARCWEIVHIEFPRLRAELGIAA